MHCKDLFTFLSNKDGRGKRGTLIAAVRGTKSEDVVKQLMKIPEVQRKEVKEFTMDFSDSMYAIVTQAFSNASIVIDCFHMVKRLCDLGQDTSYQRAGKSGARIRRKELICCSK